MAEKTAKGRVREKGRERERILYLFSLKEEI
jgi:hypothetical protein